MDEKRGSVTCPPIILSDVAEKKKKEFPFTLLFFFFSFHQIVTVIESESKMVYRERWDASGEDKEAVYVHEIDGEDLTTVFYIQMPFS